MILLFRGNRKFYNLKLIYFLIFAIPTFSERRKAELVKPKTFLYEMRKKQILSFRMQKRLMYV